MKGDDLPPNRRRALRLLIATSWRAAPGLTIATSVLRLVASTAAIVTVYAMKVIVDGAVAHDRGRAVAGAVAMAALFAGRHVAEWALDTFGVALRERTAMAFEARLVELASAMPGIEHFERPELLDRVELIRVNRYALGDVVPALLNSVHAFVGAVVTTGLLVSIDWRLLFVPVAALAPLLASRKCDYVSWNAEQEGAEAYRLTLRLLDLARDPDAAAEIRLHGLAPLILQRHARAHEQATAPMVRAGWTIFLLHTVGDIVFQVAQVGALALVALRVGDGLTAGAMVLAIGLVREAGSQISNIAVSIDWTLAHLRAVGRLTWLMDEAARAGAAAEPTRRAAAPERLTSGIDFEGVTFVYPGTDRVVVGPVDLHLPAGSTVALVGENGAGKTTLVKLLARFYEPTSGRITVDGVDLADIPPEEWRHGLAAAFQDPARFELRVRETVGVGDVPRIDDDDAVRVAVDRAGAGTVVAGLDDGLDTPLGPTFDGGRDLSGGQWQQLALARAMMRDGPLLLLLDEPTAALDPGREHELFERYAAAGRAAGARQGTITLLVSHRFSTVRMADLIVVVDGGGFVEIGSHDELMARGGVYAELYELQARAYR